MGGWLARQGAGREGGWEEGGWGSCRALERKEEGEREEGAKKEPGLRRVEGFGGGIGRELEFVL